MSMPTLPQALYKANLDLWLRIGELLEDNRAQWTALLARELGDGAAPGLDRAVDGHLTGLDDLAGEAADDLGIDAVILVAHQGLAGQFEQDAAIGECGHAGLGDG